MKKYFSIAAAMLFASLSANAQSTYDAIKFSDNNYYGTARSIALGNAMTALGGDLGSVTINPAGSAVAGCSQFTITPNISISTSNASYDVQAGKDAGAFSATSYTKFTMPNLGFTIDVQTGSNFGLTSWTMGFLYNSTNNYIGKLNVRGENSYSSLTGALAAQAQNQSSSVLNLYDSYNNSTSPWNSILAYRSGMIQELDGATSVYKGAAETATTDGSVYKITLGGPVNQSYYRKEYGFKSDMVFNFGGNVSDVFYFGINLGIPMLNYGTEEFIRESAVDPQNFPTQFSSGTSYYNESTYEYRYNAEMDGLYAKFGVIWRPFLGLRLGATFQTPSIATVEEHYQASATTKYSNGSGSDSTPMGEYAYSLSTPYAFGLGAAYTLGDFMLVSADYEFTDYSHMKYYDISSGVRNSDYFYRVNEANRLFAGSQHALRLGAEARLGDYLSLRAGYTVKSEPQRYYFNNLGEFVDADTYVSDHYYYSNGTLSLADEYNFGNYTKSYSAGVGFSGEIFFADFALRMTDYPQQNLSLYGDYAYYTGTNKICPSPGVTNFVRVFDAVLTLGMRF